MMHIYAHLQCIVMHQQRSAVYVMHKRLSAEHYDAMMPSAVRQCPSLVHNDG